MAQSIKPTHIAIILDGNRRWAEARGKAPGEGHKAGYDTLLRIVDLALERDIRQLTAYVFSTENWKRTQDEVGGLMRLLQFGLDNQVKKYHQRNIKIRFWGSRTDLAAGTVKALEAAEELTGANTAAQLNICFNYGGRRDIVEAVNKVIAEDKPVDEQAISNHLSSAGSPDPDLIIRTSGEQRLSNFLPWEGIYSELYFTEALWPDMDDVELDKALAEYANRKRRFGA